MARFGIFHRNRELRSRTGANGFHQFGRHPGDIRNTRWRSRGRKPKDRK